VCLEAGDGLGSTSLTDGIDSLTDANAHWQRLEVLIDREQHARHHGHDDAVQQIVVLAMYHWRERDE